MEAAQVETEAIVMQYQPYQPNWTGQYMAAVQQPMQYQQLSSFGSRQKA